jgi:hypothetical protein
VRPNVGVDRHAVSNDLLDLFGPNGKLAKCIVHHLRDILLRRQATEVRLHSDFDALQYRSFASSRMPRMKSSNDEVELASRRQ